MRNVTVVRFVLIILVLRIISGTKIHLRTFKMLKLDMKIRKRNSSMIGHTKL